jgi:hypothetical protein
MTVTQLNYNPSGIFHCLVCHSEIVHAMYKRNLLRKKIPSNNSSQARDAIYISMRSGLLISCIQIALV